MDGKRTGVHFHAQQRALQRDFDTERMADRINERLVRDHLTERDRALVEAVDMLFVATVDPDGQPTCSYKGGDPGFVRVLDPRTLALPSFDGNGMFLTWGNVAAGSPVGLLFIDFANADRMRVHGRATVHADDPLRELWPESQLVVRVHIAQVFPNCGRYVHHYALVERSSFVPRKAEVTPVPEWKQADWAVDVLPAGDIAGEPGDRPVRRR
jgi:uncharacterized protein